MKRLLVILSGAALMALMSGCQTDSKEDLGGSGDPSSTTNSQISHKNGLDGVLRAAPDTRPIRRTRRSARRRKGISGLRGPGGPTARR